MTQVGYKAAAFVAGDKGCLSATVTLAGTADWATAGPKVKVVKEGDFTDHAKSDGYKVTLVNKFDAVIIKAVAWGFFMEGPVAKSAVFGIWVVGLAGAATLNDMPAIGYYAPDKFAIAALVAPTAFTVASVGLDIKGSGSTTVQLVAAEAKKLGAKDGTITSMWYQPKQISTGIYPTIPRFSAKDKVKTYGGD